MKKINAILCLLLCFCMFFAISCGDDNVDSSQPNSAAESFTQTTVKGISFDGVRDDLDHELYASEVSTNEAVENGIIVCPYFSLKADGVSIPVYSTRCGKNLHSFACVVVEKKDATKRFDLKLELTALSDCYSIYERNATVVVLPEKRGVKAEIQRDSVVANVHEYGTFTFAFNKKSSEGVTIYVYEKDELKVPEGWNTVEIPTGKHSVRDTTFSAENTVYVFKSGRHLISSVSIPSNSIVYLEDGAYLEAYPEADENGEGEYLTVFRNNGNKNITLRGHGVIDFSADAGGDGHIKKGVFSFHGCTDFNVKDIISINGNSWTLCFTDCENVRIESVMIYGYRTYSDGVMLSDSRNCFVTGCFVRTGDDAMETKSTSADGYTQNVIYYDNDCWTDKGLAYGVIWETNHDVKDVYFRNCSVGFAQSNWHERLGALAIQLGDKYHSVSNVHFEDIEIYRCDCKAVINIGLSDEGKTIKDIYFKNIKATNVSGYMFRLYERDLTHKDAQFGNFYLEGLYRNGVLMTNENWLDKDSYMSEFKINTSGWKPEKYITITDN